MPMRSWSRRLSGKRKRSGATRSPSGAARFPGSAKRSTRISATRSGGGHEKSILGRWNGVGRMRVKKKIPIFFQGQRVCRVATAGRLGVPHVVPVCHVFADNKLYFASDGDAR